MTSFYTLIPCSYVTRHTLATASDAQGVHITLGALINFTMGPCILLIAVTVISSDNLNTTTAV